MASQNAAPEPPRSPKSSASRRYGEGVSNFRYRALTQTGDIVHGTISAATAKEVIERIEYLRLLPIETVEEKTSGAVSRDTFALFGRPAAADVTTFTRDLALLMKAGARLEDSL